MLLGWVPDSLPKAVVTSGEEVPRVVIYLEDGYPGGSATWDGSMPRGEYLRGWLPGEVGFPEEGTLPGDCIPGG